jgi:hypothetical protein
MALPHSSITPIPNTEPDAVPALWNTRYAEIDDNFANINGRTIAIEGELLDARSTFPLVGDRLDDIAASLGILMGDVNDLQAATAAVLARAVKLDWLYSKNRIALELWGNSFTLIDIPEIVVQSGIGGDDSIDMVDTSTLIIGDEYVIFDAVNREAIKITEILTANRVRISANLVHTYGNTAKIARTSLAIAGGNATAVIGDTYFSRPFSLGVDNIIRAVVLRKTDNAANVRVYYKDFAHTEWTEMVWSWKRTGYPIPDGFMDVEYLFNGNGMIKLKAVVEDAVTEINHIIAVPAETQLEGIHNNPIAPTNALPANNAVDLTDTPTLSLESYISPTGAPLSGVQFQLSTTADFADVFLDSGTQPAGLSYNVPTGRLLVDTDYWFRGRVQDYYGGWSDWSTQTKFTTASVATFEEYVVAPTNTTPVAGATNAIATPTLASSAFAVVGTADTHASSQWQVRAASGNYTAPLWDSGTDAVHKETIDVPADKLAAGQTTYYWRVRYNGTSKGWSQWSVETHFTTAQSFGSIIGIALLSTGGGSGSWQRIDEAGAAKVTDAAFFAAHPTFSGVVAQTVDSQAMIKVPAFYYKAGNIGSGAYAGKKALWISESPQPGFALHPAFKNAGVDIAQFWVGKYQASYDGTSKAQSIAGDTPMVSTEFATMQARCAARNTGGVTGFGVMNIYQLAAIQMLALIEIGGSGSRSLIGQGNTSGSLLANNHATVAQATWRGIVGLWGNVNQIIDGIKIVASKYTIWDNSGNKTYETTNQVIPSDGYTLTMSEVAGVDYDLRAVFMPGTAVAVANQGTYEDHIDLTSDGVYTHGGGYSSAGAGLFFININNVNSTSTANNGTRLGKV